MITGEGLYYDAFGKDAAISWDRQAPRVQDAFVTAATVINQRDIQPLQQLAALCTG